MKQKYIILLLLLAASIHSKSQNLIIQPGASVITSGNVSVTLINLGITSAGTTDLSGTSLYLGGNGNVTLTATGSLSMQNLFVNKTAAGVFLESHLNIANQVNMVNGWIDLNGKNIMLSPSAIINGETESNRILGPSGGEVIITLNLNAPTNANPGNLGAVITSLSDLGSVTLKRGHKIQTGVSLPGSINRYYDIQPLNNNNLDAVFRFNYFDAELNSQIENSMVMFKSTDGGASWINQPVNTRDMAANFIEKKGVNGFLRWTLSGPAAVTLPVTGLDFTAKRTSPVLVQLNWKTIQEINNLGFFIERKKETDNDFGALRFVNSKAMSGNSSMPLDYTTADTNSYTGKTYYRLKQKDINGQFVYSPVRVVTGEISKVITLKAWPIPAPGDFFVNAQGIEKDILQVYDVTGKLMQQFSIINDIPQKVKKLPAGTYIIRLAGQKDIQQKVIVQ